MSTPPAAPRHRRPCFPSSLLLLLLLVLLPLAPRSGSARLPTAPCPASLSCDSLVLGYFSDPPEGHLQVAFTGEGPTQPESCRNLCKTTPACAFWMYYMSKDEGECKMWRADQNPCLQMSATDPASTFFTPMPQGSTVVGGNCPTGRPTIPAKAQRPVSLVKSECPRLTCHSPHNGLLWDHPSKGHLLQVKTGNQGRPMMCFKQCRETPGCAFWMYDMDSALGDCTLWSPAQNPCLPELGSDDPSTAHYDPQPAHGSFVVGGYCKIPKPTSEDSVE